MPVGSVGQYFRHGSEDGLPARAPGCLRVPLVRLPSWDWLCGCGLLSSGGVFTHVAGGGCWLLAGSSAGTVGKKTTCGVSMWTGFPRGLVVGFQKRAFRDAGCGDGQSLQLWTWRMAQGHSGQVSFHEAAPKNHLDLGGDVDPTTVSQYKRIM